MTNNTKSFLSYTAGVVTGMAIGFLFAPDKGQNTRDLLSFRLGKYRDKLQDYITDLIQRGEAVAEEIADGDNSQAKIDSKKVVNEAREKAERLLQEVEELMSQMK